MADHDDTELACPEMPGWMRKHAARTAAAVAAGSAPAGWRDDVAELQARVGELRDRVHGAHAGPGAPGDADSAAENTAISQGALTETVGEARTAVAARTAGQGGGGRGASASDGLSYRVADDAVQRDTGAGWER